MPAEPMQEQGREGAFRAKRWLDSTTRIRISWDVYTSPAQTRIRRPDESTQLFDLAGIILMGGPPRPLLVECKNYTSVGKQKQAYREYLADAYFGTLDKGADADTQFMWVTWHPFDLDGWTHLCGPNETTSVKGQAALAKTAGMIAEAVTASGHLKEGQSVDPDLCAIVAQRLWLIVLHKRQEDHLMLSEDMAARVREGLIEGAKE